jgi:hypothetical protein
MGLVIGNNDGSYNYTSALGSVIKGNLHVVNVVWIIVTYNQAKYVGGAVGKGA